MDFRFTEEQTLLQQTIRRWVDDTYGFDQRRGYLKQPDGVAPANWRAIAELGLLGIPFAEEAGGLGGGGVETFIVMEAVGRGLVLEPFLATVVLGGGLVRLGGPPAMQQAVIPAVIAGERKLALAHGERTSRYNLAQIETVARRSGAGYVLDGHKAVVLAGDAADQFVVSARTAGGAREAAGVTLFLVDRAAPGVDVRGYPTIDGLRAAELLLENVSVGADAVIGAPDHGLPLLAEVVDHAIAAVSAEASGIMDVLVEMTNDYLKTRTQFGQPIGKFQVLQHRMAEMFVEQQTAKSMALLAAMSWRAEPVIRARNMAAVKVQIGRSGRFIGQQSVQLHGGIGVTDEYKVAHLFKRLTMIDVAFGNADHHLTRFADLPDPSRQTAA